tara:strand:- start:975 stop:1205 length:231 start_codon:yes stop_codon:yes gene_type:complete
MKDIGNLCTSCHEDTSFGSGKFVDRIPSGTDTEDGYMCVECQSIECDECNNKTIDYVMKNSRIICGKCNQDTKQVN